MKKTTIIFGVLGIFIIVIIMILFSGQKENQDFSQATLQNDLSVSKKAENGQYQSQSDSQANVTVEVVPKQLGVNEEKNIFTVNLNTHSVELDFDFTKIMVLKDNLGNTYSALEWTGNSDGHHINGDIIFSKINQQAKDIELRINEVSGVNRSFKWALEE